MTTKNETPKTEPTATATPKTEAPKAEAARPQMPWEMPMFGADAFARSQEMFARGQEAFAQMMHEQIARSQKVMAELATYEAVALERTRAAVADLTKLATDSLDYCAKLSAEWRKVAAESSRKVVEQVAPRA
jgi:hypothetical protein